MDKTCFHRAAAEGTPEEVKDLMKAGYDPKKTDNNGRTALHYAACFIKDLGMAEFLIGLDLDPNERDNKGWSPMQYAAGYNTNPSVLKVLFEGGADLLACTRDEGWPLMYLACNVNKNTEVADACNKLGRLE